MPRKLSKQWVIYALDCRSVNGDYGDEPFSNIHKGWENRLPRDFKPDCDHCPYSYDEGGCDISGILDDAHKLLTEKEKAGHF